MGKKSCQSVCRFPHFKQSRLIDDDNDSDGDNVSDFDDNDDGDDTRRSTHCRSMGLKFDKLLRTGTTFGDLFVAGCSSSCRNLVRMDPRTTPTRFR